MKERVLRSAARISSLVAATALVVPFSAHAEAPDFSQLTSGVDFSSVTTAVMAVGVVLMGVYVAIKGAKIVLGMVRGA
jgi:hypothetical protein